MNTIIILDLHLTHKFHRRTCRFLRNLIGRADQVILNGDFWDGYRTTFDRFIESPWQTLFPLLKSRSTIYLPGNHDKPEWLSPKTTLFSSQRLNSLTYQVDGRQLLIEHGHQLSPGLGDRHPRLTNRYTAGLIHNYLNVITRLSRAKLIKGLNPEGFLVHRKMRAWARRELAESQILVCGHSHLAALDIKNRYVNTGFIQYGFAQYLKIEKDEVKLVKERY